MIIAISKAALALVKTGFTDSLKAKLATGTASETRALRYGT